MERGPDGYLYFSSYIAIFRLKLAGAKPAASTLAPSSPTPVSSIPASPPAPTGSTGRSALPMLVAGSVIVVLSLLSGVALKAASRKRGQRSSS
jgi:hypothetical protein